ncbi:MAG: response regulator [Candidatus Omnitrophica bacterium]|nr:response regulator [Candidatus Omnitrophota bacterium]
MNRTVLLIDDEPDIREVMAKRLKALEWDVVTAENGEEGLSVLKEKKPDIILLDVMMPIMDGFEFFKNLKRNQAYANIPVVVLTARRLMKDTFEALGVTDFISKPVEVEELKEKMELALAKKALVLCNDSEANECILKALESNGYKGFATNDENDLLMKGKVKEYEIIVIHPAFLKSEPEEFLPRVKDLLYKNPFIAIFSDASLKGTEEGSTLAIEDNKARWAKNKISAFFDARLADDNFSKVLKGWLSES